MPFLENVPAAEASRRSAEGGRAAIRHFGGVSPINGQNRGLVAALARSWSGRARAAGLLGQPQLAPVPGRHGAPDARRRGRAPPAFVTSASARTPVPPVPRGHRAARERVGPEPGGRQVPPYYDHPGFVGPLGRQRARGARTRCHARNSAASSPRTASPWRWPRAPTTWRSSREAARLVAEAGAPGHRALGTRAAAGRRRALARARRRRSPRGARGRGRSRRGVAPIGFVSDHMEVIYDLDVARRAGPRSVGLRWAAPPWESIPVRWHDPRARPGTPRPALPRRSLGTLGVRPTCARAAKVSVSRRRNRESLRSSSMRSRGRRRSALVESPGTLCSRAANTSGSRTSIGGKRRRRRMQRRTGTTPW